MQLAKLNIFQLERAQTRAKAPDARRVLSDERVRLMAVLQLHQQGKRTDAELDAAVTEAKRVRLMWDGY